MVKCFIGIGNCSKYYLFILGGVACVIFKSIIFKNNFDPKSVGGIFGFIPDLKEHTYIQYFYKYMSYIIGGFITEYVLKKKYKKNESKEISHYNNNINRLIYNSLSKSSFQKKIDIFIVCCSYCISTELISLLYVFGFDIIEIWTLEILFVLYFMKKYFVINLHNFQKVAIIIILVPTTLLLILSTLLPYTEHDSPEEKSEDINSYEIIEQITGSKLYSIPILGALIVLNIGLAYSRVKSKVLMDLRNVSPYLIVFFIGICGTIVEIIILIITSSVKCSGAIEKFCGIQESDNSTEIYLENVQIYFKHMANSENNIYIEIFIIIPLFLFLNFFQLIFDFLIIYHFNPNYILIRDNIYFFFFRLILVLVNIDSFQIYISLPQFIILELSELLSIIAFLIYFEIIELKFCGLNRNVKRNISMRAESENIFLLTSFYESEEKQEQNFPIMSDNESEINIYDTFIISI